MPRADTNQHSKARLVANEDAVRSCTLYAPIARLLYGVVLRVDRDIESFVESLDTESRGCDQDNADGCYSFIRLGG